MDTKPKILVFAASKRKGSLNRLLAETAAISLVRAGAEVTLADLRDYPMPLYDGDLELEQGMPEAAKRFKALVRSQDGLLIASPEYNGSFSALLKNTIDWISRPEPGERPLTALRGKVAGLVSASPGPGAGKRGLKHVRELLEMIGVTVMAEQINVGKATGEYSAELPALDALAASLVARTSEPLLTKTA